MANNQSYIDGQVTSYSDIQGNGLTIPTPVNDFVNIRSVGKIRELFEHGTNSNVLYSIKGQSDLYFNNVLSTRFDYKNPNQGQSSNIPSTIFNAAMKDSSLVGKFLGSNTGKIFLLRQFILQGYQSFDETKVYNPLSPSISVLRNATLGLLGRPTRHIDTSNLISGILGGTGLGSIGRLFGGKPSQPSPPRSSVASKGGFSSILGGGDRSDEVMPFTGRDGVKGLLRGQTATNAYNNSGLIRSNIKDGGFLTSIGSYFKNNTLVGGIFPPTQPYEGIDYRADENTYDDYFANGKLFDRDSKLIPTGGFLSRLKNIFGFGGKTPSELNVTQRFHNSNSVLNRNRLIITSNTVYTKDHTGELGTMNIGYHSGDSVIDVTTIQDDTKKYKDVIGYNKTFQTETSDQLLNYKQYSDESTNYLRTHSDKIDEDTKYLIETYAKLTGKLNTDLYKNTTTSIQQYSTSEIGFDYFKNVASTRPDNKSTYMGRIKDVESTRIKRNIRPTHGVDHVNRLSVLSESEFDEEYKSKKDIIKFYFYDIVNQKYIPFNATIKGINNNNSSEWKSVEYIGRPDKLHHYSGFTRSVNFNFDVVCHSVYELLPMWKRINYFIGLTMPSTYSGKYGYITPPLIEMNIGDLFKKQPCLLTAANLQIDTDASWETLDEETSEWSFLVGDVIKSKKSDLKFAQFPMSANISVTCTLLEKTRSKVGNVIFGHNTYKNEFSNALRTE
jgi:hypothetical protein